MLSPEGGGIRFGHYLLLRRLARGGMAEVFLAQQKGLEGFDRRVAIKRILPHLAGATDFIRMFLSEAKLAAQLTHPNIVHIYEFGKHEGDYFLAMEYVDGVHAGDLYEHGVSAGDKMPPVLVARMGADAAIALHHAHELRGTDGKQIGLVHRDVSPANIMISFDGVVKLCDFGIAKAAALGEQLTTPGQVKGKYAYMSPEQTIGAPVDGRSDVFSLAIVMWELLAGRPIVSRGDPVGAMRAIRDGTLQRISKVAPETPHALADAIDWALTNQRDERASAMELTQALEAYIKASPELATSLQLGTWVRSRFARNAPSTDKGNRTEAAQDTPPSQTEASRVGIARAAWDEAEGFDGGETMSLDDDRTKALDTNRRRTPDPDHTQPAERQTVDAYDPFGNDESTNTIDRISSGQPRPIPQVATIPDDADTPTDSPILSSRGTPARTASALPASTPAAALGSNPGNRAPGPRSRGPTERPVPGLPPPRRAGDSRAPSPTSMPLGGPPSPLRPIPSRTNPPPTPSASSLAAPDDETKLAGYVPTGFAAALPQPPLGPTVSPPLRVDTPPHGAPMTLDDRNWQRRASTPQPYASDAHSAIASILGPRRTYVVGIVGLAVISFIIAFAARSCADDPPSRKPPPATNSAK